MSPRAGHTELCCVVAKTAAVGVLMRPHRLAHLVAEIDRSLEVGQSAGEPGRPSAIQPAQLAVPDRQGLPALGLGRGGQQVGQPFRLSISPSND